MKKIGIRKLSVLLCAIACILSMNPYFVWRTYAGGYMTYAVYLFDVLGIWACYMMGVRFNKISKSSFIGMLLLIILYVITYIHSYERPNITTLVAGAVMFFYLWMLILCDQTTKAEIFKVYVVLFALSLIPGIIYYLLEMTGISLSRGILYSSNQLGYQNSVEFHLLSHADYYKHYIGAVMRVNANTRFSGIYDEAGLVGTITALILCARGFKFRKNKTNIFLLICLIISFSLAGYIIAIGFYTLKWFREKQWKLFVGAIALYVFLVVFLNLKIENTAIRFFQSRIQITSTRIQFANNRLTSNYMVGFSNFLNGNLLVKMFGFGKGAKNVNPYMSGSSSYLDMIYNFGYIGFGLMIFTIVYLYCDFRFIRLVKRWQELILLILFIVSMYQRPGIYFPYYFIVLFGGQAYIRMRSAKDASN